MPRSRQVGAHAGGKSDDLWEAKTMNNTAHRPDEGMRSEIRYCGTWILALVFIVYEFWWE